MQKSQNFASFLAMPESRSALLAVQDLAARIRADRLRRFPNPLVVHGAPGAGKSHLMAALAHEVLAGSPSWIVQRGIARDFQLTHEEKNQENPALLERARQADLWILEDLQHLPAKSTEMLVQVLDHRLSRKLPTVFTANAGPRHLHGIKEKPSARLTSRLAAGLVVGIEPWQAPSRLLFLEELAQQRQFAVAPEILEWLALNLLAGGRLLEGAMHQLQAIASKSDRPIDLGTAARHFHPQVAAQQATVARIAEQVSVYYQLEPDSLQSRSRHRDVLVPRQVSMYLARKLTALSLGEIGKYFGGRDHTTVLHACRKVEQAMASDADLKGAVRRIHAELS